MCGMKRNCHRQAHYPYPSLFILKSVPSPVYGRGEQENRQHFSCFQMIYFKTMRLKLVACEVFTREICFCMAGTPHMIDVEFTAIASHDHPQTLRKLLQDKIDVADSGDRDYDAVLLCLGLCGNATAGLICRSTQLVIPRGHDCATILLGSKKLFRRHFEQMPSQPYTSRGHMEHDYECDVRTLWTKDAVTQKAEYAKRYGEDNATAIFDVLNPHVKQGLRGAHNRVVYIDIAKTRSDECIAAAKDKAAKDGAGFVLLKGGLHLIQNLMSGNWYPEDFLVVKPGRTIAAEYDWETIVKAV
jgi:Protein of unknown function (DUF1638)